MNQSRFLCGLGVLAITSLGACAGKKDPQATSNLSQSPAPEENPSIIFENEVEPLKPTREFSHSLLEAKKFKSIRVIPNTNLLFVKPFDHEGLESAEIIDMELGIPFRRNVDKIEFDNKWLVVRFKDQRASELIELATLEVKLKAKEPVVFTVSPDGQFVAYGEPYRAKTILKDLRKNLEEKISMEEVKFSPDNKWLIGYDYEIHSGAVLNLATLEKKPISLYREYFFSPDGKWLVSFATEENTIEIANLDSLEKKSFKGKYPVVSPDSRQFVFTTDLNQKGASEIQIYSLPNFKKHTFPGIMLEFIPNGKLVVQGNSNYKYGDKYLLLDLDRLTTEEFAREYRFSQNGKWILFPKEISKDEEDLIIKNVDGNERVLIPITSGSSLGLFDFSPDEDWLSEILWTGSFNDQTYGLRFYSLKTFKEITVTKFQTALYWDFFKSNEIWVFLDGKIQFFELNH